MKIYHGFRIDYPGDTASRSHIIVVRYDDESGAYMGMRMLSHVERHSPDGMNWSYGGSGPADLALSILADHFGEIQQARRSRAQFLSDKPLNCLRFYQKFKRAFVARWPALTFTISSRNIAEWIQDQLANSETTPLGV